MESRATVQSRPSATSQPVCNARSRHLDRFPEWAIGGRTKRQAGRPIQLMLHEGPTIQTDIVGPRKGLRTRIWRSWFKRHGARAGDCVMFTPVDEGTYFVGLARGGGPAGCSAVKKKITRRKPTSCAGATKHKMVPLAASS